VTELPGKNSRPGTVHVARDEDEKNWYPGKQSQATKRKQYRLSEGKGKKQEGLKGWDGWK